MNFSLFRITVIRDGPNKGRQFYSCPKGVGKGCNFFSWVSDDEENSYDNRKFLSNSAKDWLFNRLFNQGAQN